MVAFVNSASETALSIFPVRLRTDARYDNADAHGRRQDTEGDTFEAQLRDVILRQLQARARLKCRIKIKTK